MGTARKPAFSNSFALQPSNFDETLSHQTASPGPVGGARVQYHLRQIMVFLDAMVMNKPEVFVGLAGQRIDADAGRLADEDSRKFVGDQLAAFATYIGRYGG